MTFLTVATIFYLAGILESVLRTSAASEEVQTLKYLFFNRIHDI